MHIHDAIEFALHALHGYMTRTLLTLLAMAIGVASVVLLTSLGEGARLYITDQFSSLGTNLVIVLPGRNETTGGAPPMMGATPRDLTIQDAAALKRSSYVKRVAPIVVGSAPVSWQQRDREVTIIGTTSELYHVRHLKMYRGQFLSPNEITRGSSECVLGFTLNKELFGSESALGKWVRVNQNRCRVIGVLDEAGISIGVDMGDILIMPVASAESLFNVYSLFRVLVEATSKETVVKAQKAVRDIIRERHDGEDEQPILLALARNALQEGDVARIGPHRQAQQYLLLLLRREIGIDLPQRLGRRPLLRAEQPAERRLRDVRVGIAHEARQRRDRFLLVGA